MYRLIIPNPLKSAEVGPGSCTGDTLLIYFFCKPSTAHGNKFQWFSSQARLIISIHNSARSWRECFPNFCKNSLNFAGSNFLMSFSENKTKSLNCSFNSRYFIIFPFVANYSIKKKYFILRYQGLFFIL